MQVLEYMTEEQLQQVESFSIRNEFGKATFDGITDITGLILDEIVVQNLQQKRRLPRRDESSSTKLKTKQASVP